MFRTRVLLIDDDEHVYAYVRDLLEGVAAGSYDVVWASTYTDGLRRLSAGAADVALVDYRLGASSGIELIREAAQQVRTEIPLIMMTGVGDRLVDLAAMESGAAEYLNKAELTPELLDRTIRYAVRHSQIIRALAEREREYRSIFDRSPIGLAHADLGGRWLQVNRRLSEMLGYTEAELRGERFTTFLHPDDLTGGETAMSSLLSGATDRTDAERRYRRRDGSFVWVRVHTQLHRDAQGAPRYFIAAFEDVSARKAAEDQLQRTLKHLQAVISSLPLVLWALDRDGIITMSEGQLLHRFGVRAGELVGQSQFELYRDNPDILDATRRALGGEHVHMTTPIAGGFFETWLSPFLDADQRPAGTIGVTLEITERIRLEEQFRQAQKMEAVGRLAGGVAHDFNNLLTAIIGYSELALSALPDDSAARRDIEEILKAGHSAAGLTQQLLAFSRRQVLEPRVVSVNDVIARMQAMLGRLIGEDIALRTELAPDLSPIYADPSQLEQIVMNLAVNARDAMPDGGRLTISTANVDVRPDAVAELGLSAPGAHALLTVTDSGSGMTEEVRARLFEPFFTTKEGGKGTGLGLATVYNIVTQSGGAIQVDSAVGRGTTFRILLPVRGARLPGTGDDADRPAADLLGHETILLVEDQAEVRAVARNILQRSGYRVIEADGPEEAAAIARDTNLAIDLLLTDIVMPVMRGPALAALLRAERPSLKVVYTSGYTGDHLALVQETSDTDVPFVQKPFTPGSLRAKIREVLDRGPAPSSRDSSPPAGSRSRLGR